MKRCNKCNQNKSFTEFWKHSETKDGLRPSCKACIRAKSSQHYLENKKSYSSRSKLWEKNNSEKRKAINQKHAKSKKRKETLTKWVITNRDSLRAYHRHWSQKRRQDPIYRLNSNMSRLMRHSFNVNNQSKSRKTWQLLAGYSLNQLKSHLESKFQEGMSWKNYGEWHVDHIRPISSFNFNLNPNDFKICWSLNNLQPLWAKDNLKKGNKIIPAVRVLA